MTGNLDDDEYVANLLKQDAKSAKKKYELVGIDAFNPKRLKSGAPKPNTNFLRHIIRQTDSHNAALLAREAEESNARLKEMNRDSSRAHQKDKMRKERKADGRLTPVLSDEESHARSLTPRIDHSERSHRHRRRERSTESHDRRHRSRSKDARREKRKRADSDGEQPVRRSKPSKHHRSEIRRYKYDSDEEGHRSHRKYRSHRSHSRSSDSSRSRSALSGKVERKPSGRDRSRSPKRASHSSRSSRRSPQARRTSHKSKRRSPSPVSDSDPLEAIVGPLPPNVQPSVRSRGRGAHKASSMGMDSRFSSTYDPTVDVHQASDAEDDWGEALESLRDRQRWKQQGADRLKAAGFTDDQVSKWEKGDNKDEDDVTWTKSGQAREWDRGKVVDEDGHVELKAEWGRLK